MPNTIELTQADLELNNDALRDIEAQIAIEDASVQKCNI